MSEKEEEQNIDISNIAEFLVKGGINNKQRRFAWKVIMDIPDFTPTIAPSNKHPDYNQVGRDVKRSFNQVSDEKFKEHRRKVLFDVVMSVLERHKDLHYYQGFHDVASVVLTIARPPLAMLFLERLALGPLFPFFDVKFDGLVSILNLFNPLLSLVDKELGDYFDEVDVDPNFIVPYIITWFTHKAPTLEIAVHLLDVFVVSHPLLPMYLVVSLVLEKKKEVMAERREGELSDILGELTSNIDLDKCILRSIEIFKQFPPSVLLESDPKLMISKKLTFLDPNVEYPFPFPTFPPAKTMTVSLYEKHLSSDHNDDQKLMTGIVSALAIVGTIGLRMLDI